MTPDFRDRMRDALGQPAAEGHPTPDELNAYTEQALTAAAAQRVLQHLSACTECREIVYMASAAHEAATPETVVEAQNRRFRWWAWAVPAAAVVIAASTVLVMQPHRTQQQPPNYVAQATKQEGAPPPVAAPAPANEAKPEQPAVPQKTARLRRAPALAEQLAAPRQALEKDKAATPAAEAPPPFDAIARFEPKNEPTIPQPVPMQRRDAFIYDGKDAAAPAPASNQGVVSGVLSADAIAEKDRVEIPQTNSVDVERLNAKVGVALPSTYSVSTMQAKKALSLASWRVTLTGTLEHLVGEKWKSSPTNPDARLLAVSSVGANVWAAARNLELYHSGDEGKHWEQQHLPKEAHGETIQLVFTTALDGTVQTSAGELWSTHDGGKTWARTNPAP